VTRSSINDLLQLAAPGYPQIYDWIEKHLLAESNGRDPAKPLTVEEILHFGIGVDLDVDSDEEAEVFTDWFEQVRHGALVRLVERDDGFDWAVAGVRLASSWWLPVLEPARSPERMLAIAADPGASPDALAQARLDFIALRQGPPPPWVGHFYAAVGALLDTRLAKHPAARLSHLADCVSFACVAPDGSNRAAAIADLRDGARERSS
jgi:hypothetical protein